MTIDPAKLAHRITIERATEEVDRYGAAVTTWAPVASMRAEIVEQRHQRENEEKRGIDVSSVVLRVRRHPGPFLGDRVTSASRTLAGRTFAIVAMEPTEHGDGIDLTCEART